MTYLEIHLIGEACWIRISATSGHRNKEMKQMDKEAIWMKGIKFCVLAQREGDVNFMIDEDKYNLSHSNGWYQLTKNNGGYKDEFYALGIKDIHIVADNLVQYVLGD